MKKPWLILIEAVVLIFLVQSVGSSLALSPVSSSSPPAVSFPYQYGPPVVPKDVGAQGVQGPTVPSSDIGIQVPTSKLGPQTHVGPVNQTSPNATNPWVGVSSSSVSIHVLNGTYGGSSTDAVKVAVDIYNFTTSQKTTIITTTTGWANTTIPEGRWQVDVYAGNYLDNFNFSQFVTISTTTFTMTVYLVPVSYEGMVISNGPLSDDNETLVYHVFDMYSNFMFGYPLGNYFYPVDVQLVNTSATPNKVIGNALAASSNSSAVFHDVNSKYSYQFTLNTTDPFTGTSIGNAINNAVQGIGAQNKAGVYTVNAPSYTGLMFNSTYTGTLSGSFPSYNDWTISGNTTIVGGITTINTAVTLDKPYYHLTFVKPIIHILNADSGSVVYTELGVQERTIVGADGTR